MDTTASFTYLLFLYQQELRRSQMRYQRLNKTKVQLTDGLILKSFCNLKHCSDEDLRAITREILFKRKLMDELERIQHLEKMGVKNIKPKAVSMEW